MKKTHIAKLTALFVLISSVLVYANEVEITQADEVVKFAVSKNAKVCIDPYELLGNERRLFTDELLFENQGDVDILLVGDSIEVTFDDDAEIIMKDMPFKNNRNDMREMYLEMKFLNEGMPSIPLTSDILSESQSGKTLIYDCPFEFMLKAPNSGLEGEVLEDEVLKFKIVGDVNAPRINEWYDGIISIKFNYTFVPQGISELVENTSENVVSEGESNDAVEQEQDENSAEEVISGDGTDVSDDSLVDSSSDESDSSSDESDSSSDESDSSSDWSDSSSDGSDSSSDGSDSSSDGSDSSSDGSDS